MDIPKRGTGTASLLDAIRGLSALAVLGGHLRAVALVDWGDVGSPTLPLRALYFGSSFHHQAVMVFFVLSGFFISGSVLRSLSRGTWNTRRYASARLIRLYVALVPALLLGVLLDRVGLSLFGGDAIYRAGFAHMVPGNLHAGLGPDDLVRNLLFLQTIVGPVLGSNGPLWSLANEFWYYVAFPCFALAFVPGPPVRRIALVSAGGLVLAFIGPGRCLYFVVWLLGTALALAPSTRLSRSRGFGIAAWIAFAASLTYSRAAKSDLLTDFAIAGTFTLALWSLLSRPSAFITERIQRVTTFAAGFSYTLYLVHVPFLLFVANFVLHSGSRLQPTAGNLAIVTAMGVASILYAAFVWALGEKHTDRIREWIDKRTSLSPRQRTLKSG